MAYVPPNKREGFVPTPLAAQTHMTSSEVRHVFEQRGWRSNIGGDLYFNGNQTTAHPHLHMLLSSYERPRLGRDVRISIRMLAWSAGNGGVNFNSNALADDFQARGDWQTRRTNCGMNQAMQAEVNWIMSYFTEG